MALPPLPKRQLAAALLERTRAGAVLRRARSWRGLLVLAYHRIGDGSTSPFERGLWSGTADALDEQLRLLTRSFELVAPADVEGALSGDGRRVLLTFDDGYRDSYEQAFPVLRAHSAPAVFFVATGFLDRPRVPWWDELAWMVRRSERDGLPGGLVDGPIRFDDRDRRSAIGALVARYKRLPASETTPFLDRVAAATGSGRCPPSEAKETWMTWDMAREMRDAGMGFGGHTQNHPVLARLSREEQERELDRCAARLREELQIDMRWFSYPVGMPDSFDTATRQLLAQRGVRLAFSCYGGRPPREGWDRFDIPRTTVGWETRRELFAARVTLPRLFALD
jgi:peptidoglycan/xylan/chitin deacetylase (PgdA/CDA1 family)